MALAAENELLRVALPKILVDKIKEAQLAAGEAPKPGRYIRARLAQWMALDERLASLETTQRRVLEGLQALDRKSEHVGVTLDLLRDEIQAGGLIPLMPDDQG